MTTAAIIMMIITIGVVGGGFTASILRLMSISKKADEGDE